MLKAVIFDIDNTLYSFDDANEVALSALDAYTSTHFHWSRQRFRSAYAKYRREQFNHFGETSSAFNRLFRFEMIVKGETEGESVLLHSLAMYNLYWNTLIDAMIPSPGLNETLKGLKERGILLGLGTDMTAYMQYRKLERLGILSDFDFFVCSEEATANKPDSRFLQLCVQKSGVKVNECLFVGDHKYKDCYGPIKFGMQALWYCPSGSSEKETMPYITDLRDVLHAIDRDRSGATE